MKEKKIIQLSIIICTRNRAKKLATVIQCLGHQKSIEKLNWEIIIVDNNSSDNTKEVAYAFSEGSNLKINYVFESQIGLSYARNIGILTSKGSHILFLDDDILIPEDFIERVIIGIEEYPEFDIFGYRILGDFSSKKPFWLRTKKPMPLIQSFLPAHDLGVETLQYPNRMAKNPIGAAFLVKKNVFESVGPFREDLGAGSSSGLCEDTEFFWYAMLNGFKILYWPLGIVYHPVFPERLTISYLHRWYFNLGKSISLIKSKGRIKTMSSLEIKNPELKRIYHSIQSSSKLYSTVKLILLFLLLPLTIPLFFINRGFYLSTLFSKACGEVL